MASSEYQRLKKKYVKLAKRADQRLVRLERRFKTAPELEGMAYKRAVFDIFKLTGIGGMPRFNRAIPKDLKHLRRALKNVERFLGAVTSTWKGYQRKDLQKRVNTLNQKYDTNYSAEDLQRLGSSGLIDRFKNKGGSDTGMKALGFVQRKKEDLKRLVDKARKQHKKLRDYKEYRELTKDNDTLVNKIIDSEVRSFIDEVYGK